MKKSSDNQHLKFLKTAERSLYLTKVSDLFQVDFEIYLKIFNPFLADPEAITEKEAKIVKRSDFDIESILDNETKYSKILNLALKYYNKLTLKELLNHLKVSYNIEFDYNVDLDVESISESWRPDPQPDWLISPFTGSLDPQIAKRLKRIFKKHTSSKTVWYYYDLFSNGFEEEELYVGNLTELDKSENKYGCTATDIWPETEEWHLYTDYDASFAILGTNKIIADEVLKHKKIEAFPISGDREILLKGN